MIRLRVERSPVRQFLAGVAGLLLVLAAIDVVWVHELSGPPAANDDGTLTSRGIIDRRTDILWGSILLVSGSIVFIGAVGGLAIRKPVVEITDEELRLRVGDGPDSPRPRRITRVPWFGVVAVPWSDVLSVRSATDESEGWQATRVLIVEVVDPTVLPAEPWGGEWVGAQLHLDADSWQIPPEEVALRSELMIQRHSGSTQLPDSIT